MGQAQNICACPIFTMLHLLHTKHTQPIITLKVCKCTPQTIFGLNSGKLQTSSLLCYRMACIENRWVTLKGARRKSGTWGLYHTTITYTPNILHLTLTRHNSLIVNTLLSVRCYKIHLHATYTTYMLPHGTSTGGGYYGIGEQNSLLLRQISLRPYGVPPPHTTKTTAWQLGVMCKMYAGECKIL